jgi:hypothetical protein
VPWNGSAKRQPGPRLGTCLDCEASVSGFARALVKPGYKLGVAATGAYEGVERGALHVDKVLHVLCPGLALHPRGELAWVRPRWFSRWRPLNHRVLLR